MCCLLHFSLLPKMLQCFSTHILNHCSFFYFSFQLLETQHKTENLHKTSASVQWNNRWTHVYQSTAKCNHFIQCGDSILLRNRQKSYRICGVNNLVLLHNVSDYTLHINSDMGNFLCWLHIAMQQPKIALCLWLNEVYQIKGLLKLNPSQFISLKSDQ